MLAWLGFFWLGWLGKRKASHLQTENIAHGPQTLPMLSLRRQVLSLVPVPGKEKLPQALICVFPQLKKKHGP